MPDWSRPEFDWDDANEDHILRHNVYPDEAEQVFFGDPLIRRRGDRYVVYGRDSRGRYLFVICVERGQRIRVVTARPMDKGERRHYERHH